MLIFALACPPSYINHDGSCYSIFPILRPLSDTSGNFFSEYQRDVCKDQASWGDVGHLVTITSEEENTLINRISSR